MRRSEEINFSKALNGKLELTDFRTALSSLPAIFTAISVASFDKNTSSRRIDTDIEGLEKLSNRIDETKSTINWYTSSVGELLAEVDAKELSDSCTTGLGWLVNDLGNIASRLDEASYIVRHDLETRKEAISKLTAA